MEYATLREEQLNRIEAAQHKLAERQLSLSMKSEELNQMKLMQREQFMHNQQSQEQLLNESFKRQAQQQRDALEQQKLQQA